MTTTEHTNSTNTATTAREGRHPRCQSLTIDDLRRRAAAGDQRAFASITHEFDSMVRATARRAGVDAADLDDVVQDVWLRLLRGLANIHDGQALPAWLVTTTRRAVWTNLRKQNRQGDRLRRVADLSTAPLGPEERAIEASERRRVRHAYEQLGARDRALLDYTVLADRPLPYAEVAEAIGCAVGSVGALRLRSLVRVQRAFGAQAA